MTVAFARMTVAFVRISVAFVRMTEGGICRYDNKGYCDDSGKINHSGFFLLNNLSRASWYLVEV